MSRLGCSTNSAFITYKCAGSRLCDLPNASSIRYERVLDEISTAEVIIPISGTPDGVACCECLGDAEPWCHVLNIVREAEGAVVWTGPIIKITYGHDQVVITARDKMAWLQVRVNEGDINYSSTAPGIGPADLTDIAEDVVQTAMEDDGDSPCVLDCILKFPSPDTAAQQRYFPAFGGPTAFDDFQTIAETGMDWTVVNNCLILGGDSIPATPLGVLTDEMILGDLSVTKDGDLQANRVFVRYSGDDVTATCTAQGSIVTPCPAVAECEVQCYGRIERIREAQAEGLVDVTSAKQVAQAYINAACTAPRTIEFPSGTRLSPDVPWELNDMIPGQRIDVALTQFCFEVGASFRLQRVTVEDTATDGETISVDLALLDPITGNV